MREHNERKATKGRVNQVINLENGRTKIIRHETNTALQRKVNHFKNLERIETQKVKWYKAHPEYQKKE